MTFQYLFFDTYIGYFFQALPIALLVSAIYGIIRYRKDKKTSLIKKLFSCIFVCYITGLICIVLFLDIMGALWYNLIYLRESGRDIRFFDLSYNLIPDFFARMSAEKLLNLALFVPFGILYPLSKEKTSLKNTLLFGIICISAIEFFQPIFGRAFDINDIILNFLGLAISSCMFFFMKYIINKKAEG